MNLFVDPRLDLPGTLIQSCLVLGVPYKVLYFDKPLDVKLCYFFTFKLILGLVNSPGSLNCTDFLVSFQIAPSKHAHQQEKADFCCLNSYLFGLSS